MWCDGPKFSELCDTACNTKILSGAKGRRNKGFEEFSHLNY